VYTIDMSHTIFRAIPPWETVVQILNYLNISLYFPTTFQRCDLQFHRSPDAVNLLRPYYKPCKARQYLNEVTEQRWITLLRHILSVNGYEMKSQETTRNKKKAILYTIQKAHDILEGGVVVKFS
jgi:hypothetical protein